MCQCEAGDTVLKYFSTNDWLGWWSGGITSSPLVKPRIAAQKMVGGGW